MTSPSRLVGVDVARAVAILGMLWSHFAPDGTGEGLADGRSSILFATLAGVSLGLMTGGSSPTPDRRRALLTVALRGFWLIVLGRALWAIGTPIAVILDFYGVAFLLLLPVLLAPRWVLAVVAAVAAVGGAHLVATVLAGRQPDFRTTDPVLWPREWLVTGWYPVAVWAGYIAIGLLVARCDLTRTYTQLGMIALGSAASATGYGIAATLGLDADAHSDTTWEALGSGGLAVAVIGALLLVCRLRAVATMLSPLAAAGSMPLTIYTGQIVALALVLVVPPRETGIESWVLLTAIAIGSIVFAVLWRRYAGRGPLEQTMASLTAVAPPTAREERPVR